MQKTHLALENIRSLYNVGAILRTCSFFGIQKVFLIGYSGKNFLPNGKEVLHEKLAKTALGSENDIEIVLLKNSEEFVEYTKKEELEIVAVEQTEHSISLKDFHVDKDCVLVFGNEVEGVSKYILSNASQLVQIDRLGEHNSLNVTTAVGVTLFYVTT